MDKFFSFALQKERLDAYIVGEFPKDTLKYIEHTVHFKEQWSNLFSKTRAINEKIYQKGFIQIHF